MMSVGLSPAAAAGVAYGEAYGPLDELLAGRQERAVELARDGLDSKACSALLSTGVLGSTPGVLEALRSKHPAASPPDLSDLGPPPPGAAPGPPRAGSGPAASACQM